MFRIAAILGGIEIGDAASAALPLSQASAAGVAGAFIIAGLGILLRPEKQKPATGCHPASFFNPTVTNPWRLK